MLDFYIDNISATSMGMAVEELSITPLPSTRQTKNIVPGKSGYIVSGDDSLNDFIKTATCFVRDVNDLPRIYKWLRDGDKVTFSTEADRYYRYTQTEMLEAEYYTDSTAEITISFDCQPYRYDKGCADVTLTTTGSIINSGNVECLPRITVTASTAFTLTVGSTTISVDMASGATAASIIIDSEMMECLETDGTTFANSRVTMSDYPVLAVGSNTISWTGTVTSVVVERRCRYL